MGSILSDAHFNTIIMSSLPESYCPTLQTITAAEQASTLTGSTPKRMKASDLIDFLMEEAHHRIINNERSKNSNQALWPVQRTVKTNQNATTMMTARMSVKTVKNQVTRYPTVGPKMVEKRAKALVMETCENQNGSGSSS